MDLTKPIDITAITELRTNHENLLVTIDSDAAGDILKHFTPMPGIKDSIILGRTTIGSVSHKYTGQFIGQNSKGEIVPRRLTVYPCVMEMEDEPERYRRQYWTEVKGGLDPNKHPFELWLLNFGIKSASQDLYDCLLTAKKNDSSEAKDLKDSFDGPWTILEDEITAGNISTAKGNLYETGELTRANIGTKLLAMWRAMPDTFRRQNVKMYISNDLGDMYDDWLTDQGVLVMGSGAEEAGQKYLKDTQKRVELVRLGGLPSGCQFVVLTMKDNIRYGYDSESDLRSLKPFNAGNPYKFTAAGKYVLGFQFVTLDKHVLCVNDQPVTPEDDEEEEEETKYTVTLTVNDESMGSVTGGGEYTSGATATIKATPKEGYVFVKWSDNDTNATRTITVSDNVTLTATFEADAES